MSGDDDNIGRLVAERYRLDSLLGRGGFGSVYRGWDTEISRDVAVKLLDVRSKSRSASQEAELRARFRLEARAAGRIKHPGVVTVFDFGLPDDGTEAYLVMELLEGHDLADELTSKGPLHPQRALRLFTHLLDGLGRGHALGVVHKDIKPQNVFVRDPGSTDESLCLVDFGVARVVHEDKLTMTGLIVGTPQYMAPEYITETLVTPALDVYQMGLLLAESITGVPAVPPGESFVKSCNRHFTGDLDVPKELYDGPFGAVLRKALAPNPRDRYQDGASFCAALREVGADGIGIEMQKTTVFRRSERAPTFDQPPLFPPMRPEQASAELERLERDGLAPDAPTEKSQPAMVVNAASNEAKFSLRPNPAISSAGDTTLRTPAVTPMAPVIKPSIVAEEGPSGGVTPPTDAPEDWHWGQQPSPIADTAPPQPPRSVNKPLIATVLFVVAVILFGTIFLAMQLAQEKSVAATPEVPAELPPADPAPTEPSPTPADDLAAEPLPTMPLDSEPSGAASPDHVELIAEPKAPPPKPQRVKARPPKADPLSEERRRALLDAAALIEEPSVPPAEPIEEVEPPEPVEPVEEVEPQVPVEPPSTTQPARWD